jgi:hypothetical protein
LLAPDIDLIRNRFPAKAPSVNAGSSQPRDFSVTIEFTIAADVSKVNIFLEASDLCRGVDTRDQSKIGPVVLNTGRQAEIFVPPVGYH